MANTPEETLAEAERTMEAAFAAVASESALRSVYARFLGREGTLTLLLKRMPELAAAERKSFGQRINGAKQRAESLREQGEGALRAKARAEELARPALDVTLPGRKVPRGRVHPLMRVQQELVDTFASLGFDVAEGPECELAEYNFDKLAFPPDHPAMDMQDTFFLEQEASAPRVLLRTHTSPVQIREMLSHPPPVMIVAPGCVYRRDDDATHSPMFMQLEGLVVDKGISMVHLKGTLDAFVHRFFGDDVPTKLRASYFPFTEPSVEMDMGCLLCRGKDPSCRVCKGTGWIEILGAGMVDPQVFVNVGYDPEVYSGFAFGLGIDRLTMLRYRVPHLNLLYHNDVRFLQSL